MERKKGSNEKAKKAVTSGIPDPFSIAPAKLSAFVQGLNPAHVYIVHIDRVPWQFKRQIFMVPVILNIVIAALLSWRLYAAVPTYLDLIFLTLGFRTPAKVDHEAHTRGELIWITLRRAAMIALDYALLKIILPWPLTFFFESPGNPVSWRRSVGFQDKEIIVRISRGWNAEDITNAEKKGLEIPFSRRGFCLQ